MNNKIAQVVVGLPVAGPFDYVLPVELYKKARVGARVKISFHYQRRQGVIVGLGNKSKFKNLKPIELLLDEKPLVTSSMLALTKRLSEYYGCSWGEAIETVLPDLLRKPKAIDPEFYWVHNGVIASDRRERSPSSLKCFHVQLRRDLAEAKHNMYLAKAGNPFNSKKIASSSLKDAPPRNDTRDYLLKNDDLSLHPQQKKPDLILLHDLSRSQRWPFLIDKIQESLARGQGIIFLVPELSMIAGVLLKLKAFIDVPIAVFDRKMTPRQELKQWLAIQAGGVSVVIGSRSTVFAPARNLGLMIVYDEENSAYKQEQSPFYHVREVVLMRSSLEKSSLIFVSSSPSLELWQLAAKNKIRLVSFPAQKLGQVIPIDLTNFHSRKTSLISFPLRNHIEKTLSHGGKAILFMNRRGFSLLTRCYSCGYTFKCLRCDVNLSYSYAGKKMICRHCHATVEVPAVCPKCQNTHLRSIGTGIEKLESELARIFPHARLALYDQDTQEAPRGFDILVATQAVLRIQDAVSAQLIGCIHIDSELNRPILRAAEHTFALLVRLRLWAQEKLVVQTRLLENDCIQAALKMDFKNFYKKELSLRRELCFPPFKHLVAVNLRGVKEKTVLEQAYFLYTELGKILPREIDMLEPQPDMVPKLRDKYRFTIMLKGKSVKKILTFIKNGLKQFKRKSGVTLTVNVDP